MCYFSALSLRMKRSGIYTCSDECQAELSKVNMAGSKKERRGGRWEVSKLSE